LKCHMSGKALAVLSVLGAAAMALSACSSSAGANSSTTAPRSSSAPQGRPLASGTIASVAGSSMVVQNPRTGQVTVDWTASTAFNQTVSASGSDLAVGECVQVLAATGSSPAPARTITITKPVASGCSRPAGSAGGAGRGFGDGGALPFTSVFGTVSALDNGTLTVRGATGTNSTGTTTFSYDSSTTLTKVQSAHASSVATGQCASAFGTSTTSGAVAATSITLRPTGPNGCLGGFRGGGFGGSGPPTTGSSSVGA
jgi:hypothetical protein